MVICPRTLLAVAWLSLAATVAGQDLPVLSQTIALPGVEGRIDHLAVDVKGQRLFVAALGNNTLEVVGLRDGKRLQTLAGLAGPQGAVYDPESGRLFVTSGQSGRLDVFEGNPLRPVQSMPVGDDADNVRLDAGRRQVVVGYGSGALAILDPRDGRSLGEIKLPGHPEAFQLEAGGPRIFVNVPGADQIVVVDREKKAVVARWPLELLGPHANFPLVLDEPGQRVFVGCRVPARVLVYETATGKRLASLETGGDTDDLFYDAKRKRLYVACGGGSLDVFGEDAPDRFHLIQRLPTAPGARTTLFVPDLDRLCVAVPHRGAQEAEIRVYHLP